LAPFLARENAGKPPWISSLQQNKFGGKRRKKVGKIKKKSHFFSGCLGWAFSGCLGWPQLFPDLSIYILPSSLQTLRAKKEFKRTFFFDNLCSLLAIVRFSHANPASKKGVKKDFLF